MIGKLEAVTELHAQPGVSERVDGVRFLLLMAQNRFLLLRYALGAAIFSTVLVLLLPSYFTATARIMPPQQNQSLAPLLMGQLGPLAGLANSTKDLSLRNPSDLYISMLKSQIVTRAIIARFNLSQVYGTGLWRASEEKLRTRVQFTSGKDGIITVEVEDRNPKRAAAIANAYIEELRKVSQDLTAKEAEQRRHFFESQLTETKDSLVRAEANLRKTQETTGVIELNSQARVLIESIARLRAEVAAKQVALKSMASFATPQNPDWLRGKEELTALQSELTKLEQTQSGTDGTREWPTAKLPESGLEYVRNLRDVKYYEIVYELLAKQFEAAKLDEVRTATSIQVLDSASEPERRSWPPRVAIVLLATIHGLLVGIFAVLIRDRLIRMDDTQRSRWATVWSTFSGRI